MLYLLDANVLIDANRDYYSITRVPEFWEWLIHRGTEDDVKIPREVYEEIRDGDDDLGKWAREKVVEVALLLNEEVNVELVSQVVDQGYAPDLTDDEVDTIGRDPFLIAYAWAAPEGAVGIVTTEASRPSRQRANRHVPDVCNQFGIQCLDPFEFVRALDFSTDWRSSSGR